MADERMRSVGLGNPGVQYLSTRHTIGFMVIDALASRARIDVSREKFSGYDGAGRLASKSVVLLKPQTFMNRRSGRCSCPVFQDQTSRHFGGSRRIRCQLCRHKTKGERGQRPNGLAHHESHRNERFYSSSNGIGRAKHGDVSRYVLSGFSSPEETDWLRIC